MEKFFDEFMFGRPIDLVFNTAGTKDMIPANWTKTNDGYKATCRTVGIDPKDVSVSVVGKYICVKGATEYEGSKYDVSYKIPVQAEIMAKTESINYKTVNGMTYIYLVVEKAEEKKIAINKI